jgi:Holliday junction resolvasome RuvABC DNA-binding subunit
MMEKHVCTPVEHVLKYALVYLGFKKTANDEMIEKIKNNDDNDAAIKGFLSDSEH